MKLFEVRPGFVINLDHISVLDFLPDGHVDVFLISYKVPITLPQKTVKKLMAKINPPIKITI